MPSGLPLSVRKRLGKRTAVEIEAEIRRMQVMYQEGKKFDFKVYGLLMKELRNIDRIAVKNGGMARQDIADFDDWIRRTAEKKTAAVYGSHVSGTSAESNPRTFCEVRHEERQTA